MTSQSIRVSLLVSALLFVACGQKSFDSEKALWSHVKDPENGYCYVKELGHVKYTITYRPIDVLVRQELPKNFSEQAIDSLRKKYGEYLYFNLELSANNQELLNSQAGDRTGFGAMVNQLAFGMEDKLHLISKTRDTIPLADYIYPRMYGMSNSTNLLLVYPRDKELLKKGFFHFTIEDLGLGTGEVGFKIPTKNILKEPKLNFTNTL